MISRSQRNYPLDEPERADATKREDRKSSREPESGEVESQRSGGLFNERRSFRRERARRWCNTDRGRKRESDTPYALGRSDHDSHEIKEDSQCGSGGLEDCRPSRTNMAKLKLEGQLDVVEYSRVTVPESVDMGDPAGSYGEKLKARNSARGHLMAWSEKRAMQEYLKELTENSNLNRKDYGTVMSSEANEIGLEKLLEISWRVALQSYFDETMLAPATVAAYLAHPCMRTDL